MNRKWTDMLGAVALAVAGLVVPLLFPAHMARVAELWLLVVLALGWDVLGGRAGYNALGNVLFFGIGMVVSALAQQGMHSVVAAQAMATEVGMAFVAIVAGWPHAGLVLGLALGGLAAALAAALLGGIVLGLRGHHFAIATLGLAAAGGELAASWGRIGADGAMVVPASSREAGSAVLLYWLSFALAMSTVALLAWFRATRLHLVLNAIRDDEDKVEALGLNTVRAKVVAWALSAFFIGLAGAVFGNLARSVDPIDIAFNGAQIGAWMILAAILGGRGTLWGPVLGAVVFFIAWELLETWLAPWQGVALGASIIACATFLPRGIGGWAGMRRERDVLGAESGQGREGGIS